MSEDGGKAWSKVRTMDVAIDDDDLAVSHGVFLSHAETRWAFLGSFHGFRQKRAYSSLHAE